MLYLIEEISQGEDWREDKFEAESDKEAIKKFTYSYDEGELHEISSDSEIIREVAKYEYDALQDRFITTINEE